MIRKHTPADLEVLLAIWFAAQSLAHPFLETSFLEQVKSDMRNKYLPGSDTWVYAQDDEVKGFISMMGNEIGGLFVDPATHKQGIGLQLVEHVKPLHGHLEVEVFEQNHIGKSFYLKHGFHQIKSYFHGDIKQQVLRLRLD